MKPDQIHQHRQGANHMQGILLVTGAIGSVATVLIFMKHGLVAGLASLISSVLAFALARLFELVAELVAVVGRLEEQIKPRSASDDAKNL